MLLPSLKVTVLVGLTPLTVAESSVNCPAITGLGIAVTVVLLVAVLTVNAVATEVLVMLLVSPAYAAVMLWLPVVLKV